MTLPPSNQQKQGELSQGLSKEWKFVSYHPQNQIISNPSSGVRTWSSLRNICKSLAFISQIEPKNWNHSIIDENWVMAMQEELKRFEKKKEVWELIPKRNKMDEHDIIVRNKAKLVVQGYNQ